MKAVKSFLLKGLSAGTTISAYPIKQCLGILLLSTKPKSLKFFSSNILAPASINPDTGIKFGP